MLENKQSFGGSRAVERALVIADDPWFRRALRRAVQEVLGCSVDLSSRRRWPQVKSFDLVIFDVGLLDETSFRLVERIIREAAAPALGRRRLERARARRFPAREYGGRGVPPEALLAVRIQSRAHERAHAPAVTRATRAKLGRSGGAPSCADAGSPSDAGSGTRYHERKPHPRRTHPLRLSAGPPAKRPGGKRAGRFRRLRRRRSLIAESRSST